MKLCQPEPSTISIWTWLLFQIDEHIFFFNFPLLEQPKKFVGALQRVSERTYNSIFTIQQMRQIAQVLSTISILSMFILLLMFTRLVIFPTIEFKMKLCTYFPYYVCQCGLFQEIGLHVGDFDGFVSSLNNQGFLLKKGPKVFQLQTTDYWRTNHKCCLPVDRQLIELSKSATYLYIFGPRLQA